MKRRQFFRTALGGSALAAIVNLNLTQNTFADVREKARPLNLKITDLKTFVVDAQNDENFVFVKIYTNQGIVGLGEGTLTGKGRTVEEAILEHKRYLVGKDPTDIENHWQGMFRGPRYRGGPVLTSAISAVEIALWDILGQALGQPIWKLLGGRARNKVRIYPHDATGNTSPKDRTELRKLSLVERWLKRKEEGWTACKTAFLDGGNPLDPARAINGGIESLKAVREAVGPDFDICVELHGQMTTPMALEYCQRAEEYRPFFVEEATQLEDLEELALLRSMTKVPLATGERLMTKYGFNEICARHLVNYVQPDVVHCGGILEMKKIGTIAEAFRVEMSPHNPQSEVCTMASLHVCMCTPSATLLEIGSGQSPFWNDLFFGGAVQFENGFALAPDRPGLGIDLDETVAARFPYQPKNWHSPRFGDGSIADR